MFWDSKMSLLQNSQGMAEMLKTNDKLEELDLGYNPLGSDGVTWIAEALESNEGLKHLLIDRPGATNITL